MRLTISPLILTLLFVAAMWLAARWSPQFVVAVPAAPWIAALVMSAGVALCALGVASFRKARTTFDPARPEAATSLVVAGVYRISRNPMYVGFLVFLLSWAVWLSHTLVAVIGPLAFIAYLNRFQIGPEEKALRQMFGSEFEAYTRQVRRGL